MEVLLKRSKITKSIFNQIPEINFKIIYKYEVLGFVRLPDGQHISTYFVFYNPETNHLAKCAKILAVREDNRGEEIAVKLDFSLNSSYNTIRGFSFSTQSQANDFMEEINKVLKAIYEKGQFYL